MYNSLCNNGVKYTSSSDHCYSTIVRDAFTPELHTICFAIVCVQLMREVAFTYLKCTITCVKCTITCVKCTSTSHTAFSFAHYFLLQAQKIYKVGEVNFMHRKFYFMHQTGYCPIQISQSYLHNTKINFAGIENSPHHKNALANQKMNCFFPNSGKKT